MPSPFIEAKAIAARLLSRRNGATTPLPRKIGLALVVGVGLALFAMPERASAVLRPDGSNDAAYQSLGVQYQGSTLWLQGVTINGFTYHASAVRLDDWNVLTAAHLVSPTAGSASLTAIGNGSSFLSSPGTSVGISDYVVYSGWDGTFQTPDLAIIHLAQPLSGSPVTIGSASVGEVVNSAGFGRAGTPSLGLLPVDGNLRGWRAPILDFTVQNVSSVYYFETSFISYSYEVLNGKGISGDSGGGVYNQAGQLIGINIAQWGNFDTIGGTDFLKLAHPDVFAWITANTYTPPFLTIQKVGSDAIVTWSGNYTLQTSTNLNTGFVDLPAAASPFTNSLASGSQGFFRLRSVTNAPASASAPASVSPSLKFVPTNSANTNRAEPL